MTILLLAVLGLVFFLLIIVQAENVAITKLSEANSKFSLDMFEKLLVRSSGKDVLFCPICVNLVLGATYIGARGKTGAQMEKKLYYPDDRKTIFKGFNDFLKTLNGSTQDALQMANNLYVQKTFPLAPDFIKQANLNFKLNPMAVDFKQSEVTVKTINDDVANVTDKKITEILSTDVLDVNSRMLMVNAIYFKGKWLIPCKKSSTSLQNFFLTQFSVIENVPIIHLEGLFAFAYVAKINAHALVLPFKDEQYNMLIILPTTILGLQRTLKKLKRNFSFEKISNIVKKVRVEASIPQFKIEGNMKLGEVLTAIGLTEPFGVKAAFSGVSRARLLHISDVAQKAIIEIDGDGCEEGTAENDTLTQEDTAPVRPEFTYFFNANHPFLYVIRAVKSGVIMLFGAYRRPHQD